MPRCFAPLSMTVRGGAQNDSHVLWAFTKAGEQLTRLHVDYEKPKPYPLKFVQTSTVAAPSERRTWRAAAETVALHSGRRRLRDDWLQTRTLKPAILP